MAARAHEQRLALGAAAVVRPSVAASWLPMADGDAIRWLKAAGLIHVVLVPDEDGTMRELELVSWGEVLAEIEGRRERPRPGAASTPAPRRTLPWSDPRGG